MPSLYFGITIAASLIAFIIAAPYLWKQWKIWVDGYDPNEREEDE